MRIPTSGGDIADRLRDLAEQAEKGELRYAVILATTRDHEVWTSYVGDDDYARPFHMVGMLESLKQTLLLQSDEEVRQNVREAAENARTYGDA